MEPCCVWVLVVEGIERQSGERRGYCSRPITWSMARARARELERTGHRTSIRLANARELADGSRPVPPRRTITV